MTRLSTRSTVILAGAVCLGTVLARRAVAQPTGYVYVNRQSGSGVELNVRDVNREDGGFSIRGAVTNPGDKGVSRVLLVAVFESPNRTEPVAIIYRLIDLAVTRQARQEFNVHISLGSPAEAAAVGRSRPTFGLSEIWYENAEHWHGNLDATATTVRGAFRLGRGNRPENGGGHITEDLLIPPGVTGPGGRGAGCVDSKGVPFSPGASVSIPSGFAICFDGGWRKVY